MVSESHAERAAGTRKDQARIESRREPPLEVCHAGLIATSQPLPERLAARLRRKPRNTCAIETFLESPALQLLGNVAWIEGLGQSHALQ
jgi:hypothetical protein